MVIGVVAPPNEQKQAQQIALAQKQNSAQGVPIKQVATRGTRPFSAWVRVGGFVGVTQSTVTHTRLQVTPLIKNQDCGTCRLQNSRPIRHAVNPQVAIYLTENVQSVHRGQ